MGEHSLFSSGSSWCDPSPVDLSTPTEFSLVRFAPDIAEGAKLDLIRALVELADEVHAYHVLPFAEVKASPGAIAEILRIPEVADVISCISKHDAVRPIVRGIDRLSFVCMRQLSGLDHPSHALHGSGPDPTRVVTANLSLGPASYRWPYLAHDPVNMATRALSEFAVVTVAAGNCGSRKIASTSAWSRPPWVLSVGACDENGQTLAQSSSVGDTHDRSTWPDVVAWGQSQITDDPDWFGTSFAAPRVGECVMLVANALLQLQLAATEAVADLARMTVTPRRSSPLVGRGIIDQDFRGLEEVRHAVYHDAPPPKFVAKQLPSAAPSDVELLLWLAAGEWITSDTIRQLVKDAARPVPNHQPFQVGSGFVDLRNTVEFLADLTIGDLAQVGPHPPSFTSSPLSGHRPFRDVDASVALGDLRHFPSWYFDVSKDSMLSPPTQNG